MLQGMKTVLFLIAHAVFGLEPLKLTYHEPAKSGERVGKLIESTSLGKLSPSWAKNNRRMLAVGATSQFGNVALTTVAATTPQRGSGSGWSSSSLTLPVGTSIFGAFEAGFSSQQDGVITGQFGCSTPSLCYSSGGWHTGLAQGACATACGITLPRTEGSTYYGFLDTCGGHTNYHFHQDMSCVYTTTSGHSTKVGEGEDTASTPLYGKYEDYPNLPSLDACGGHFGFTPDSPTVEAYHHHVQEHPPYTFGCYGPNENNGLVTLSQCRAVNSDVCGTGSASVSTVTAGSTTYNYDTYCPCFDGSGSGYLGAGLNTYADTVELAAVSNAGTKWDGTQGDGTTVSPSPSLPPPDTSDNDPCFPSSARVTLVDGTPKTIGSLKEGEAIVTASMDGTLTSDTVSLISIAKPEVEAAFITLLTDTNLTLTLTPEHHIPVGDACCTTLSMAKNVRIGETIWVAGDHHGMASTIVDKRLSLEKGLHSPVMTHGTFPVVNGIVTAFDSIDGVTLAEMGLAYLIPLLKATGTASLARTLFFPSGKSYIDGLTTGCMATVGDDLPAVISPTLLASSK